MNRSPNIMHLRHWLFCSQRKWEIKLKDATARRSAFGQTMLDTRANDHERNRASRPRSVLRRSVSASSIAASVTNSTPLRGRSHNHVNLEIWGSLRLSTKEKLVSPRPLDATHILVIHPAQSTRQGMVGHQGTIRRVGRNPTFSEVVELPINDLLFILNVPNLFPPRRENFAPILPHRLHKEMPRVLMEVPHLDTFPELMVYLHTKNQAALFRNFIPEWMRDIMHPLPPVPVNGIGPSTSCGSSGSNSPTSEGRRVRKLLGRLVGRTSSSSTLSLNSPGSSVMSLLSTTEEPPSRSERSLTSIAVEIAEAAWDFDEGEPGSLDRVAGLLDALRDNLNHVGYFAKGLWDELDICREIVRKAISHQMSALGEDEQEELAPAPRA
ncbi:hypothetical protein NLJ89_g1496 [Agrocybe chaxingu]|uniref:Uncharacterized protein n=1 Tax=Agrocybe chaxingu TaxID=84603 RepID=A0A9W8TDB8_9AGAR|nr:hypothetical protein NLJ89_g1496 [Agrocybe chaxingu]